MGVSVLARHKESEVALKKCTVTKLVWYESVAVI